MTDTSSARDAGQAPSSEQPQAGQPSPSSVASEPQAGQSAKSSDDYERMIAELRKENASHRTKLSAFEKAQAEADAAKLSDLEKATKKADAAEAAAQAYKARIAAYEIKIAAQELGIIDPDLAALAIAGQLEYDDDGTPTNAGKLLADLLKAKPYLAPGAQVTSPSSARPATSSGGAVNPGRSATTGANDLTWDLIKRMSPDEYNARRAEILPWMARNTPKH